MDDNGNGQIRPALIPQPHGGALLAGGIRGGPPGPGRPRNELRAKMREILYLSQEEVERRLQELRAQIGKPKYDMAKLRRLPKNTLLEMIERGEFANFDLTYKELTALMDVAGKYGLGVQRGDVPDTLDGLQRGVVLLPAVQPRDNADA